MIKRMVIMLVAVAVVFGGIFGFQVVQGGDDQKFITALEQSAADHLRRHGRNQRMATENRSHRLAARGQGRRFVARGVRRGRVDLL